jgi:hypothetical protein
MKMASRLNHLLVKHKGKWASREPQPGDHVRVHRHLYSHHGVYIGDGKVIHFSGTESEVRASGRKIIEDTLDGFAGGGLVEVLDIDEAFKLPVDEIVMRARSRLDEMSYRLLTNNCEHFANWCVFGEEKSWQVKRGYAILVSMLLAAGTATYAARRSKSKKEGFHD